MKKSGGSTLSLRGGPNDRVQFRLRDDHPLRSGNAEYTAPKAPKMFTRIAARKHIKLHDTSEHTANVAQRRRHGPGRSFVYFILFAVQPSSSSFQTRYHR